VRILGWQKQDGTYVLKHASEPAAEQRLELTLIPHV